MTPQQMNRARQTFGLSRKEFGRRIGLHGRSNNIWNEVKRMETGEREIPDSIALAVNMMLEANCSVGHTTERLDPTNHPD